MTANELMIGDIVSHPELPYKYGKVSAIDEYSHFVTIRDLNGDKPFNVTIKNIEPVLLTEGVLALNGFEYDNVCHITTNNRDYYSLEHIELEDCLDSHLYPIPNTYRISVLDKKIRLLYIHQFQHALRLVGLNDLADNFKIK